MLNRQGSVAVICPVRCLDWEGHDSVSELPDQLRGKLTTQTLHSLLQSGFDVYAVVGSQDISDYYRKHLDWVGSLYHGRLRLLNGPAGLAHQVQCGIEHATQDGAAILALMSPENVEASVWLGTCLPPIIEGWCKVVVPSRYRDLTFGRLPTNLLRWEHRSNAQLNQLLDQLDLRKPEEDPWDAWSGAVILHNDEATRRCFIAGHTGSGCGS